jgi:hypothetical protein
MTGELLYLKIHDAENRIWRVDVSGDLNVGTVHNANPIFPAPRRKKTLANIK